MGYLLPYTVEVSRVLKSGISNLQICFLDTCGYLPRIYLIKKKALRLYDAQCLPLVTDAKSLFTLHIPLPSSGKLQCFGTANFRAIRNIRTPLCSASLFYRSGTKAQIVYGTYPKSRSWLMAELEIQPDSFGWQPSRALSIPKQMVKDLTGYTQP